MPHINFAVPFSAKDQTCGQCLKFKWVPNGQKRLRMGRGEIEVDKESAKL